MSVNSKMTAIADEIRELSGASGKLGLDDMATKVADANTEISGQTELINQIVTALESKAAGGGVELPELTNEGTSSDMLSGKQLIDSQGNVVTGTFTIDNELNTQGSLIEQITTAIVGKTAGSVEPILQEKTVTPTASSQNVVPDSGYDGLSKVIINGDTNLISGNIKNGVSIFGVNGNYVGDGNSSGGTSSSLPTVSTGFVESTADGRVIYSILGVDNSISIENRALSYFSITKNYRFPLDERLLVNTPIIVLTSGTITMPITSSYYLQSLVSGTGYSIYQYAIDTGDDDMGSDEE